MKDRECGSCSVCCVVLNVDTPEFQKLPRIACAHLCDGGGCAIHATRFPVCRTYFCGWRYIAKLGEDWRPDKSGVLIDFQVEGFPAGYTQPGVRFMATGDAAALFKPALLFYLGKLVETGVPVTLAVPGPPGHFPAGIFLNDMLKAAVAARDLAGIESALRSALKSLETHVFSPVLPRHETPAAPPLHDQHGPEK